MPVYRLKDKTPSIAEGVFLAPSADIIGDVRLAKNSNVWFNAVVRGDINYISIGEDTNIQDNSLLHVVDELPLIIGSGVTVGHQVTLHACTVEDNCLIGMGAVVLDGAVIGKGSVVAAGALVPPGKVYPPYSMIMGSPALVKRPLTDQEIEQYNNHYHSYLKAKTEFQIGLQLIENT
jgi:carbonic anhydrase/acetyltransferase-like protein (isoleucine patch superfamily)